MVSVALLSNPHSTGNRALLPRIRAYCARNPDVFHYEVERVDQIPDAMKTIARVQPKVIVINGGDGSVQAALTELHGGRYFGEAPPPVAVLPNGKTNLIALDLGARGDPIDALENIVGLAQSDLAAHIVQRELIALSEGDSKPVLGMFLGGAGLADSILYCRHKIYPLGLPNGLSHVLTALAVIVTAVLGIRAAFLPPRPSEVRVSLKRGGQITGRFTLLIVTTLEKLLLGSKAEGSAGHLKLMAVEQGSGTLLRAVLASIRGRLGRAQMRGVHIEQGDEIEIEGERSNVILDGELFQARTGKPIVLRTTPPVPFLKLAA
ncbi:diacylglycerol kinase [Sphingomonas sp. ID1715]|uniref:diacylglycerol/lipid kinase family protein n=1 Tax=Sphingomonas sp. ID1715 TaxID=1656898 RepID=UPI001487896A|nr:acylglycerol kinase family protein [Sphingomonas sp. ID1715]NNM78308.1 diacylglycerol kinase [Sphingomonas sp. ID1715]